MLPIPDTHRTLPVEQHPLNQNPCFKTQVVAMQHWLQEATRCRPAEATLLIDVEVANAGVVPGIEVRRHWDTHFDGGLCHVVEDIPDRSWPLHAPLTADTVMFRCTHKMIVKALEDRTHVVPTPAGKTKLSPVIIIRRLAAHGDHGIDRRRTADHLPARIFQRTAVKARFLHCLEHPVGTWISDSKEITDWNVKPDPVVVAASFQNQNTVVTIGR